MNLSIILTILIFKSSVCIGETTTSNDMGMDKVCTLTFSNPDSIGIINNSIKQYKNEQIQHEVRTVPEDITTNLKQNPELYLTKLVHYYSSQTSDTFLLIKFFHDWIADNIIYDINLDRIRTNKPAYITTLEKGKSVCEGFASLFLQMCKESNIECIKINGFAKGVDYQKGLDNLISNENHAWNGVKIQGKWYLVDVTWDSFKNENKKYVKKYSTNYLFANPNYLKYTHFPTDKNWQLLDNPTTWSWFINQPRYYSDYFEAGLQSITELNNTNYVEEKIKLFLPAPDNVVLLAEIKKQGNKECEPNKIFIEKTIDGRYISASFPTPGKWELIIFIKNFSDGIFTDVARFLFEVSIGTSYEFPKQYGPCLEDILLLEKPLKNPLKKDNVIKFKIYLPGYKSAFLASEPETRQYRLKWNEKKGTFSTKIRIPNATQLTLYATKQENNTNYPGILSFDIIK